AIAAALPRGARDATPPAVGGGVQSGANPAAAALTGAAGMAAAPAVGGTRRQVGTHGAAANLAAGAGAGYTPAGAGPVDAARAGNAYPPALAAVVRVALEVDAGPAAAGLAAGAGGITRFRRGCWGGRGWLEAEGREERPPKSSGQPRQRLPARQTLRHVPGQDIKVERLLPNELRAASQPARQRPSPGEPPGDSLRQCFQPPGHGLLLVNGQRFPISSSGA